MHRVGFIVPQDFQVMSVAALTVFELANLSPAGAQYEMHLLSKEGGPVRSSSGIVLQTEKFGEYSYDTIIVGSITKLEIPQPDPALTAFVKAASAASRRTASICSGAFVLAQAGLLNGRRATMHWAHADNFRMRFPDVRTEEDRIFIRDGSIWTSAGMTAGVDLVLALIDSDLGPAAAKNVASLLVMNQRRLGGQKQHAALLDLVPKSDRIESVLTYIRRNLRSTLSVQTLAAVANLSPRQFSRAFTSETGQSPARAVERLRCEAASFMIEEGRHPVNVIALETGFIDRERMRRAFVRSFGTAPRALRNARRQVTEATGGSYSERQHEGS
jgi:transcriptional regulator GlxA family with amidase domain